MPDDEALPITFRRPVTLVGGGMLTRPMLDEALALAPELVAADGGADHLAGWELMPAAVIGDMDSISLSTSRRWQGATRLVPLAEQDTTDFEKCLYATGAPLYVGAGFTGGRVDHLLAVLHVMLARPEKRVVLLGEVDAIALVPPGRIVAIALEAGARVSLLPLLAARGTHSYGLKWPVVGVEMAPGVRGGASNMATGDRVELGFDAPGMALVVDRRHLAALVHAIA